MTLYAQKTIPFTVYLWASAWKSLQMDSQQISARTATLTMSSWQIRAELGCSVGGFPGANWHHQKWWSVLETLIIFNPRFSTMMLTTLAVFQMIGWFDECVFDALVRNITRPRTPMLRTATLEHANLAFEQHAVCDMWLPQNREFWCCLDVMLQKKKHLYKPPNCHGFLHEFLRKVGPPDPTLPWRAPGKPSCLWHPLGRPPKMGNLFVWLL